MACKYQHACILCVQISHARMRTSVLSTGESARACKCEESVAVCWGEDGGCAERTSSHRQYQCRRGSRTPANARSI
eukprot:4588011-Pleurochrysis_carterae.AAC.1